MNDFSKDHAAVRGFLLGREYNKALMGLTLAEKYHKGTRRNGDPEFSHQLGVIQVIKVLPDIASDEENLITIGLLHDLCEDYDVPFNDIEQFGLKISESVERLTKTYNGVKKPNEYYFSQLEIDPLAALVKGADRIHNLLTATDPGAFTTEKLKGYLEETNQFIIPMMKSAQETDIDTIELSNVLD